MPSGTINLTTTSTNDITARIEWSESNVNIANNTSDVTVNMIVRMNASWYATTGSGYFSVTCDGQSYSNDHWVSFASGTHEYTVLSHTFTVTHSADGSKTASIVCVNCYVAGTTGLSKTTGSGNAVLTTIARASQPTCPSTGTFGSTIKITTNRASSSFTHTLTFAMGSSHSTSVTGVGADYTWTIPAGWADVIPEGSSVTLTVTCTTYNGSTNIGSKTCSSTISIPSSWAPSASISISRGGTVGDNNVILKGLTTVTLTCSGTATTGSSISSYKWSGGSTATSASITASTASVGSTTYTCTVTDRRGKTASSSYTVTVVDPASSFTCADSVSFGSALAVSITRKKSTFTHTVRYRINTTYTTDQTGKTTSDSFTVPTNWSNAIPSSTSTTMAVTVYTYNGSTQIGTASKNVTVNIPSSWAPSVSISTSYADMGTNNEIISLVTTATLTASASASTGTSISSYSWSGGAVSGTGATKTHKAGAPGTYTYTVTATDSRGRTGSKSVTITFVDGTSSFTVPSSVNFGSALAVSITRMKSSFTHTVKYQISSDYTKSTTGVGTSDSYTIPNSWAASVPNASSINLTVTVTTYSGSTSLGGSIKRVTVNVPSSWVPTIGSISATPINGFNGLYLKGVSKATIAVSSGAASTGATIVSYKYAGNNISGTNSSTSTSNSKSTDILATIGTNTYTVTITDSRGRTGTKTIDIEVLNYSKPSIRETVGRYTSGGVADNFGDHGRIIIAGSYTNITGNTWTITAKYKKRLYSTYTTVNTWTEQTGAIALNSDLFVADVDSAYDCWVEIVDAVGFRAEAHTTMSTGRAVMDYYKDRVIGVFSTASETLREEMGNPETLFFSNAANNIFNGYSYIPNKLSGDGRENDWFRLNDVSAAHLLGNVAGGNIPSNMDLNDYVYPGTYWVSSNSTAQTISNLPSSGIAGQLLVIASTGGRGGNNNWAYLRQEFHPYHIGDGTLTHNCYYVRYGETGNGTTYTWKSWQKIEPFTNNKISGTIETVTDGFKGGFLELVNMGSSVGHGGYIDFHYNNSSADYTARIIESVSGRINIASASQGFSALTVANNLVWNNGNALRSLGGWTGNVNVSSGSVTNLYSYTFPEEGQWFLVSDIRWTTDANSTYNHYLTLYDSNGSAIGDRYVRNSMSAGGGSCLVWIISVATAQLGRYIRLRAYQGTGATRTASYSFQLFKLRSV